MLKRKVQNKQLENAANKHERKANNKLFFPHTKCSSIKAAPNKQTTKKISTIKSNTRTKVYCARTQNSDLFVCG